MSASRSDLLTQPIGEPADGSLAWLGALLVLASGMVSVTGLLWAATKIGQIVMR